MLFNPIFQVISKHHPLANNTIPVDASTVLKHLRALGMLQMQEYWVTFFHVLILPQKLVVLWIASKDELLLINIQLMQENVI